MTPESIKARERNSSFFSKTLFNLIYYVYFKFELAA